MDDLDNSQPDLELGLQEVAPLERGEGTRAGEGATGGEDEDEDEDEDEERPEGGEGNPARAPAAAFPPAKKHKRKPPKEKAGCYKSGVFGWIVDAETGNRIPGAEGKYQVFCKLCM